MTKCKLARNIICNLGFCFCTFVLFSIPVLALDTGIKEDTIKAIYSYKFGKFTEWPASKLNASSTFLGFCILGKNPFSQPALDAIMDKRLKEKALKIKFFANGLIAEDALPECHIIFISQSEKQNLETILAALHNQAILTVSDIEGFSAQGGMIALFKINHQIRFKINQDSVEKAGLSMSSKLLTLAKSEKKIF